MRGSEGAAYPLGAEGLTQSTSVPARALWWEHGPGRPAPRRLREPGSRLALRPAHTHAPPLTMRTPTPPLPAGLGRTGLAALVAAALLVLAPPAGAQSDFAAGLQGPIGFTQLTDGTVLVAEFSGGRISAFTPGGARTDFATGLANPYGLTQLADGRVLVAENANGRVSAFPAGGGDMNRTDFATGLSSPSDVTQLADGTVLVSERGNRVSAFPASGGNANRTDFATNVTDPLRVVQLADGRVLVGECSGGFRVSAFPASGGNANRTDFATGLGCVAGIAPLTDGRILVADLSGRRTLSFPATGGDASMDAAVFDATARNPYGVTQLVDSRVLIADYAGDRVISYGSALVPSVPCTASAPLSFDADGDGAVTAADFSTTGTERVAVRHEAGGGAGGAPVDLSDCSLVTFDPFTERAIFSAVPASTVAPGTVYTLATSGGDQAFGQPDVLFDDPGAFALVTGTVSAGADVSTVFGRVVAAVVYDRDGSVFASVRGGLPEAEAEAQAASFAAAMARVFGRATSAEGEGGADLAVRAWPNPSRGAATVAFGLAQGGAARVAVYDALGREVAVVADGPHGAGRHEARVAAPLPAGAYVVRVASPDGVRTARLTVAR